MIEIYQETWQVLYIVASKVLHLKFWTNWFKHFFEQKSKSRMKNKSAVEFDLEGSVWCEVSESKFIDS